jgi:hypothetical protein
MTTILFYSIVPAFCKHATREKNKRGSSFVCPKQPETSVAHAQFARLQTARKNVKKVLRGDFYGVRGCCRTCLRERAEPGMRGFRKWRDRLRWVCLCFECRCRRCTRLVYGKCRV